MSDDNIPTTTVENTDIDKTPVPPGQINITWTTRRNMSIVSLACMILTVICFMFIVPESRIDKLEPIVSNALWAWFSIIAVYMGSTTLPVIQWFRKN